MKKIIVLILAALMSLALLAGCGNPVYDDLANFLNVEMVEVNAEYEKMKTEIATWDNLESDEAIGKSINDVLLPLVNSSLDKLAAITPATEEVKAIKDKYVKVMDEYKAAFEALLEGTQTQDDAVINEGVEGIDKAVALLDEYNAALEELAEEVGAEVEY